MATDSADDAVLRSVRAIDWSGYPMPPSSEWYEPDSVPAAFESLVEASSEQQGRAAYNAMLFAVGNNHAEFFYPAAAAAAPLVVRVAREGNDWVRHAALEILIEFVFFGVDREQFVDPTGKSVDAKLYAENAVNHQIALEPVEGRAAIEWVDPQGFHGCGFFQVRHDLIVHQRGYWDRAQLKVVHPDMH